MPDSGTGTGCGKPIWKLESLFLHTDHSAGFRHRLFCIFPRECTAGCIRYCMYVNFSFLHIGNPGRKHSRIPDPGRPDLFGTGDLLHDFRCRQHIPANTYYRGTLWNYLRRCHGARQTVEKAEQKVSLQRGLPCSKKQKGSHVLEVTLGVCRAAPIF